MGYSKYELNTINMLYSLKEFLIFLHPYLPITATSPQRPISSVPKVAVVERFDYFRLYLMYFFSFLNSFFRLSYNPAGQLEYKFLQIAFMRN